MTNRRQDRRATVGAP